MSEHGARASTGGVGATTRCTATVVWMVRRRSSTTRRLRSRAALKSATRRCCSAARRELSEVHLASKRCCSAAWRSCSEARSAAWLRCCSARNCCSLRRMNAKTLSGAEGAEDAACGVHGDWTCDERDAGAIIRGTGGGTGAGVSTGLPRRGAGKERVEASKVEASEVELCAAVASLLAVGEAERAACLGRGAPAADLALAGVGTSVGFDAVGRESRLGSSPRAGGVDDDVDRADGGWGCGSACGWGISPAAACLVCVCILGLADVDETKIGPP